LPPPSEMCAVNGSKSSSSATTRACINTINTAPM
jgi:hypothetical protein